MKIFFCNEQSIFKQNLMNNVLLCTKKDEVNLRRICKHNFFKMNFFLYW